jgi:flagellar motor switch protein FliM
MSDILTQDEVNALLSAMSSPYETKLRDIKSLLDTNQIEEDNELINLGFDLEDAINTLHNLSVRYQVLVKKLTERK